MITISIFDIPFLANSLMVTIAGINDTLVDLSGSAYTSGSYDTFEAYLSGSTPGNSGYGWNGPWQFDVNLARSVFAEDFLTAYSVGTVLSGSNGGSGWADAWNVIEGT